MINSGIYYIVNNSNGKVYIGKTMDLVKRQKRHFDRLRLGKHTNSHLQSAYAKQGKDAFEFAVLLNCGEEDLTYFENFMIGFFKSSLPDFGYNKTTGGEGGTHTPETRLKISKSKAGKTHRGFLMPESGKLNISKAKIGKTHTSKPHSEETKNKISVSTKGRKSGFRKLTEIEVKEIMNLRGNMKPGQIASKFGVSWDCVNRIFNNETYREVA